MVGCRSEHARARQAAAAAGGLKATALEVETTALARAAALAPPALLAVVDLGDTKATLLAIEGGALLFARQEPFDAHQTANGTAPEVERTGAPNLPPVAAVLRRPRRRPVRTGSTARQRRTRRHSRPRRNRDRKVGAARSAGRSVRSNGVPDCPSEQRPRREHANGIAPPTATGNAPVSRQTPRAEDGAPPPGQGPPPIPHGAGAHVDAAKSPVLATACGLALRGVAAEPGECPAAVAETPPPTVGSQP